MSERNIGLRLQLNGANLAIKNVKQLETELNAAKQDLKELEIGSNLFKELASQISNAEGQLQKLNEQAAGVGIEKQLEGIGKFTGGITSSFAAATAAVQLFGVESEDVTKAAAQAQNILTIALSARGIQETLLGARIIATTVAQKAQTIATLATNTATKALFATIAANPIGALLTAIGLLVGAVVTFIAVTNDATLSQEDFNKEVEIGNQILKESSSTISAYERDIRTLTERLTLEGATIQEIFEATRNLRELQVNAARDRLIKLNNEIDRLIELGATEEQLKQIKEERIQLANTYAELVTKQQNEELRNSQRLLDVERTNQKRRVELIRNELQRNLQLLKLNYEEQRKLAIKNGEDITLIDKKYYEDRKKILEDFGNSYLQKTNSIYLKLGELIGGDFLFRLNQLKLNQLEEEKELIKFNESRLKILKEGSEEYIKAQEENDLNLRALVSKNQLELNKFIETNAKSGYKVLLDLEKTFNQEFLNEIKKRLGVTETFEKFSIDSFRREYEEKTKLERIFLQNSLNAESERFFQNALLGKAETKRQKKLVDDIAKIRKENANDEKKQDEEILKLKEEYYKQYEDFALRYYDEVTKKGQQFLENQLLIDIRISKNKDIETMEKLQLEEFYYFNLTQLQEEYVDNDKKLKKETKKLELEYQLDLLTIQRETLEEKLKILEKDPTLKPEELQRVKNELLKIEIDTNDKIREINQNNVEIIKQNTQDILNSISTSLQQFTTVLGQTAGLIAGSIELQFLALENSTQRALDSVVGNTEEAEKKRLEIQQIYEERRKQLTKQGQIAQLQLSRAQAVANVAEAVTKALTEGPIIGQILAGVSAGLGAIQVGLISQQIGQVRSLQGGGVVNGPSHSQGGVYFARGGVELEGNEAVINRRSTLNYGGLLNSINQAGGGRPIRVESAMDSRIVEVLAGQKTQPIRAYVIEQDITKSQAINRRLEELASF